MSFNLQVNKLLNLPTNFIQFVINSPKRPLKLLAEIRPSRDYATREGPSYLRQSGLHGRHRVQRLKFIKESVTVRRAFDGPCCSSIVKFRELFSVPKFPESKCFGTKHPLRSVVGSVDQDIYYQNKLYCSKTTKQVVTIHFSCGNIPYQYHGFRT